MRSGLLMQRNVFWVFILLLIIYNRALKRAIKSGWESYHHHIYHFHQFNTRLLIIVIKTSSSVFLTSCYPDGPLFSEEIQLCTSNLLRYVFWQDVGGKRLNIYCKALGITTRRQEKGQLLPTKQTKSTICLFASRIGLLEKTKLQDSNCKTKAGMLEYANNSLGKGHSCEYWEENCSV